MYLSYACIQYQKEVKSVLKMLLSRPRPHLNYLKYDIILSLPVYANIDLQILKIQI